MKVILFYALVGFFEYSFCKTLDLNRSELQSIVTDGRKCNHTCNFQNQTLCWGIPCPPPPCDKPVLKPGDCCESCPCPPPPPCAPPPCVHYVVPKTRCPTCPRCPHGPDCEYKGVIILYGKTKIINGKRCTCEIPGIAGEVKCV